MKEFSGKRHVGAHVIRPIKDFNEVNYHLLEATAIHLYFTRGPPPTHGQNGQARGTGNGAATNAGADGLDSKAHSVSPMAWKVYCTIKDIGANEGMHAQMVASQMGIQVADVYKGTEELVRSGYIYTTVDDDTWAAMDQ